jgi:hypothetical protein
MQEGLLRTSNLTAKISTSMLQESAREVLKSESARKEADQGATKRVWLHATDVLANGKTKH